MAAAGNICAIKCFSGTANAAEAAVDAMKLEKVVASLAGDDTIFVLCHSDSEAREFTLQIKAMLNGCLLYTSAGQAIDRVGVMLSLNFPAGPELENLSEKSNAVFKIKP